MEHASYGWAKRVLDMGDKPTLHVVIIYQNRTAGYRAKDFYERTVSAFDGACDFRLDLWNFQGSRDVTGQQNCGESRRAGGPGHPFYVPQMPAFS